VHTKISNFIIFIMIKDFNATRRKYSDGTAIRQTFVARDALSERILALFTTMFVCLSVWDGRAL